MVATFLPLVDEIEFGDLVSECFVATVGEVSDGSEQHEESGQALLTIDKQILAEAVGHHIDGHGDDCTEEVLAALLVLV